MRAVALFVVLLSAACAGARVVQMPVGAGTPAPEGHAALAEATIACAEAKTYHANLRVSGTAGGQRVPGVTIGVAVTANHLGLTATGGGSTIFTLAGTAERAQLLLHDNEGPRVVTEPAADILDAVIGLKIGPAELLEFATACHTPAASIVDSEAFGPRIRVTLDRGIALLVRDGRWRVVAREAHGLRAGYTRYAGQWPVEWRVTTLPDRVPITDLKVRTTDPDIQNVERPAERFAITIPATATPMKLDELRASLRR